MGDYPVSYRGKSKEASAGFPRGVPLLAGAGFLAPAAAEAIKNVAPAIVPAVEAVSGAVARTAVAGLLPIAMRALPWLAVAYGVYRLAEWSLSSTQPKMGGGTGYTVAYDCGYPEDFMSSVGLLTCAQGVQVVSYPAPAIVGYPTILCSFNIDRPRLPGTVWARAAKRYNRNPTGPYVVPSMRPGLALPEWWFDDQANFKADPAPAEFEYGFVDPLARPGFVPWLVPQLPYRLLPHRVDNPFRAPSQRTGRGYSIPGQPAHWPSRTGGARFTVQPDPVNDPDEGFVDPALPLPPVPGRVGDPEAPGQTTIPVSPDVWPWGDLPGWVAQPQVPQVGYDLSSPPVTAEMPEGAVGPTIIIGNGPPVGPHLRVPPAKGTKERKARRLGTGGMLLIRKVVNPVTEGLEVVDCFWSSLPKDLRWAIQKADFKRQAQEAAKRGVKLHKQRPTPIKDRAPKIDLGAVLGKGWEGQSITLPGGTRNPVKAEAPKYRWERQDVYQQQRKFGWDKDIWKPMSPQQKMAEIYRHYDKLDLDSAIKCIAANHVEDRIHGGLGQQANKAAKVLGRHHGVQAGPLF